MVYTQYNAKIDYAWCFKTLHYLSSSAWVWLLLLTQYWAGASSFIWLTACWGKVGAPWVAPSPLNRNPPSTSLQITILCWVNSIHWIRCKLSFKERHITLIFDAFALNLGILRNFNANFEDKSTVVLIFTLFYVSCWFSRFSWSAADFAREACFLSCSPSLWSSWISRASPWQDISLPLSLRNIRDINKYRGKMLSEPEWLKHFRILCCEQQNCPNWKLEKHKIFTGLPLYCSSAIKAVKMSFCICSPRN